ncbi:LytTR family DNA-binding domain-containing protein [Bowmanella sp. Y26]|uniref:LytR/AlgR family response regulator transcription factor n=1 Tax=Bowmanella yangjiangensis TaxID=2811230 RepID=UPI001BDCE54E|nr:LytTR family DNA-binding domain-containing protein [Bowmanella yangjiangensis]MBT1064632.1 LytTR family DNA-binding domain-containing protein [Bowmanella yangjiangensis]
MYDCVIVDDEVLARERVAHLLNERPGWHVVAEAREFTEAREVLLQTKPSVCFMDIEIIGGSGFQLANELCSYLDTRWVFTTAYGKYAVKAFEINAFDYLLKPFSAERVDKVLDKLEAQLDNRAKPLEVLSIRSLGNVQFVRTTDILWIRGAGNYMELHCHDKTYLYRESMTGMEACLDPCQFIRVHRSAMINRHFLKAITSSMGRYNSLEMVNGDEVRIGQGYRHVLFQRLGLNLHE